MRANIFFRFIFDNLKLKILKFIFKSNEIDHLIKNKEIIVTIFYIHNLKCLKVN